MYGKLKVSLYASKFRPGVRKCEEIMEVGGFFFSITAVLLFRMLE